MKSEVAKGVVWRGWKSLTRSPFLKENCSRLHIEGLWGARGQISRNARWLRSSGRWDACCKILIFAVLQAICESFGEVCLFARALARCFRPTLGEPHITCSVFGDTALERPGLCELRLYPSWRRSWTMQDRQRIDPARLYIRSFIRRSLLVMSWERLKMAEIWEFVTFVLSRNVSEHGAAQVGDGGYYNAGVWALMQKGFDRLSSANLLSSANE